MKRAVSDARSNGSHAPVRRKHPPSQIYSQGLGCRIMVAKANIKAPMPSVSLVINNNKFILSDVIDIILI